MEIHDKSLIIVPLFSSEPSCLCLSLSLYLSRYKWPGLVDLFCRGRSSSLKLHGLDSLDSTWELARPRPADRLFLCLPIFSILASFVSYSLTLARSFGPPGSQKTGRHCLSVHIWISCCVKNKRKVIPLPWLALCICTYVRTNWHFAIRRAWEIGRKEDEDGLCDYNGKCVREKSNYTLAFLVQARNRRSQTMLL